MVFEQMPETSVSTGEGLPVLEERGGLKGVGTGGLALLLRQRGKLFSRHRFPSGFRLLNQLYTAWNSGCMFLANLPFHPNGFEGAQ